MHAGQTCRGPSFSARPDKNSDEPPADDGLASDEKNDEQLKKAEDETEPKEVDIRKRLSQLPSWATCGNCDIP